MSRQPAVRRWGLVSATAAPLLLIGGWTLAASRQRGGFDPVVETISALAARGPDDRWVMTAALAGLGAAHLTTALALRGAALPGRVVLGVGGVGSALVAAFPLPDGDGGSVPHALAAGVGFVCLGVWPLLGWHREGPALLRTGPSVTAGAVLLGLVGWFFLELVADSDRVGLSERVAAGTQALWPLAVVGSLLAGRKGTVR